MATSSEDGGGEVRVGSYGTLYAHAPVSLHLHARPSSTPQYSSTRSAYRAIYTDDDCSKLLVSKCMVVYYILLPLPLDTD